MLAWEAVVSGACEYARVKMTLCLLRASRLGVSPRVEPRKPMRSARVVSSVMRTMLGGGAASAGADASRSAPKRKRADRRRAVGKAGSMKKGSLPCGRLPSIRCLAAARLERELYTELHVALCAGT